MKRLYVLFDLVAKAIAGPVGMYGHDTAAIRAFSDACEDPQSPLAKHVEDYELRQIGVVNEETCEVFEEDGELVCPRVVITGAQWKAATAKGPELAREA